MLGFLPYQFSFHSLPTNLPHIQIENLILCHQLTKTYWEGKSKLGADAAWWNGVSPEMLSNVTGKLHPGALKYYMEVGFPVTDAQM